MKTLPPTLALLAAALSTQAQTAPAPAFKTTCDNSLWSNGKTNRQFCETRDLAMAAPAGQPLTVSADPNGGITVHGWDGPDVRIRTKIQTWSTTEAEATARINRLVISTINNVVRATDPEKEQNWSVSYEIFVPRTTALVINTLNGGISLDNLQAAITFETTNGSVNLANLGGEVKGETTNGGVNIALTGSKWEGKGLDVATTNGGIYWKLPRTYSAQLFTSTNMGGIHTSLPVTKSGMFHKEVTASLGQGGATVKAVTTNGSIDVSQEQD